MVSIATKKVLDFNAVARYARAMSLKNKHVVVLGGTSGIGFATAAAAAREGAIVTVASSTPERVERALEQLPGSAKGHVVDLSTEDGIQRFFQSLGSFDHLAYTAAENLQLSALAEIDFTAARTFLNLRFWGAYAAAKYGIAHINAGGSIVLTSGIASQRPGPGWTLAASICGAMEALTRALAVELAPIRVNAVAPGLVKTPLWNSIATADLDALYDGVSQKIPAGRPANADEIAQTYLYLMRETYSTGQTVVVDGGTVLV